MSSEYTKPIAIPPPSDLTDEELRSLYSWIDTIPLSRPKRNFTRDFGDGVMTAEILKLTVPKLVELHNYPPANSAQQKLVNWHTLNYKVLRKIGFYLSEDVLISIVNNHPGVIESVLIQLQRHLSNNNFELQLPYLQQEQPKPPSKIPVAERKEAKVANIGRVSQPPPPIIKKNIAKTANHHPFANSKAANSLEDNDKKLDGTISSYSESYAGLDEKDQIIQELQETVQILQVKINKLEQLVQLKDRMIEDLKRK